MAPLKRIDSKKGVIFDFDDTLAKTGLGKNFGLKSVSLKIYDYLKKEGVSVAFNDLYKKIKRITKEIEDKKMYNRNFWWSSVIKEFLQEPPKNSFLDELTIMYWDAVEGKSKPYKDAIPVLLYLKKKGYALGIVSDTDGVKEMKSRRIKKLNFNDWFDVVVVAGENTKQTKPDKGPFLLASKKLHLKPKQCVFVGNNPFIDILGAKKAGMTTVLVKRDGCDTRIDPDRVIHALTELKRIL